MSKFGLPDADGAGGACTNAMLLTLVSLLRKFYSHQQSMQPPPPPPLCCFVVVSSAPAVGTARGDRRSGVSLTGGSASAVYLVLPSVGCCIVGIKSHACSSHGLSERNSTRLHPIGEKRQGGCFCVAQGCPSAMNANKIQQYRNQWTEVHIYPQPDQKTGISTRRRVFLEARRSAHCVPCAYC